MASLQPAQMTIKLEDISFNDTGAWYQFEISKLAALVNRRHYPQGLEWAVAGIRVHTTNLVDISVSTIPTTWVTANAWNAYFRAWQRQLREAEESQGTGFSERAAYRDFKVHFDENDATGYHFAVTELHPAGYPMASFTSDATYEWEYSSVSFPEAVTGGTVTSHEMHFLGADGSTSPKSLGMIHGYANSRRRPVAEDPNVPEGGSTSSLLDIFDYGDNLDTVVYNNATDNVSPPYYLGKDNTEEEYYPGGKHLPLGSGGTALSNNLEIASITAYASGSAGTSGQGFIPGFTAPCGLVRLWIQAGGAGGNLNLWLDLVPGPYKGYMARPMQELN